MAIDIEKCGKDIGGLLGQKPNRLGVHNGQSFTPVLIVESLDFQLMAPDVPLKRILGVPEENGMFAAQLWFTDTSLKDIDFGLVISFSGQLAGPHNLGSSAV